MNDSTTGLTSGERVGSAILSRAAPRRGYGLRSAAPVRARDRDRSLRRALAVFLVAFAALLAAPPDAAAQTEVPADWSLIPAGLGPGDSFRLLFATSTTRDATSTDIDDYNSFVQTAAAAGHAAIQTYSAGFRVVGSTADDDARDNTSTTGTGVPIYWLGGAKVADNNAGFYDGDWDEEANAKDEDGSARSISAAADRPFTGSNHDGTATSSNTLGTTQVRIGRPNSSTSGHGPLSGSNSVNTTSSPFYALSGMFVVVPPPGRIVGRADLRPRHGRDLRH